MKQCCICGANIQIDEPGILFVSSDGQEKEVCERCEAAFVSLSQAPNAANRKATCHYFRQHSKRITDPEVQKYLSDMLDDCDPQPDTSAPEESGQRSGASAVLRSLITIFTVFCCIISIVIGALLGKILGNGIGIAVAVYGCIVSLLWPLWSHVKLDIADDLRAIHTLLEKSANNKKR